MRDVQTKSSLVSFRSGKIFHEASEGFHGEAPSADLLHPNFVHIADHVLPWRRHRYAAAGAKSNFAWMFKAFTSGGVL
jgi:hypothetical protein